MRIRKHLLDVMKSPLERPGLAALYCLMFHTRRGYAITSILLAGWLAITAPHQFNVRYAERIRNNFIA